jgi:hypothetical protein
MASFGRLSWDREQVLIWIRSPAQEKVWPLRGNEPARSEE